MRTIALGAGLIALLLGACSDDPAVSDTGYRGTWVLKTNRTVSMLSIAERDSAYLFRWKKYDPEGTFRVDCDWNGRCVEWRNGEKGAEYQFTANMDPASGRLRVACAETWLLPIYQTHHYTDELVVEPGGKVLWSYTVERDGNTYPPGKGPQRAFTKVADAVADPPRKAAS